MEMILDGSSEALTDADEAHALSLSDAGRSPALDAAKRHHDAPHFRLSRVAPFPQPHLGYLRAERRSTPR